MATPQSGTTSFDDVLNRCRTIDPAPIEVHFDGGIAALEAEPLAGLRPRPFKWRTVAETNAADEAWIMGLRFRQIVLAKRQRDSAHLATGPNSELKNWFYKASSLAEMVRICQRQGSSILVGFEGGRSALRRSTAASLRAREYYKWDWADMAQQSGVKNMSNWLPGDEFIANLREIGDLIN